jgi:hypothetical protein
MNRTDSENCSGREEDRRDCINADEDENAGRSHFGDPVVEDSKPLLDRQKLHREKERDHNCDQRNDSSGHALRDALFIVTHLRTRL